MTALSPSRHGFVPFYRRYTKTWIHALATAGLTAFGMLTFVHRGFAIVAVAVYVLPPIVLYFRGTDVQPVESSSDESANQAASGDATDAESSHEPTKATEASESAESTEPTESNHAKKPQWTTAETPTEDTLFDAVVTKSGAYAVGEDGVVLACGETTDSEWQVRLSDGPGADGRTLRGADTTEGGESVWFAGDGGSLGRLDTEMGRHVDYSAPSGITDNWTDIAVSGTSDSTTILLVNGSGQVLRGKYRDGDLAWDDPTKPGSGSSLCAVTLVDGSVGYCCDTNDSVFETTDGGESFRKIGVDGVDGTFTAISATAQGDCAVTTDDGVLHRYADGNWTPERLGEGELRALALGRDFSVVCGEGGIIYERAGEDSTTDWERIVTSADELRGAAVSSNRGVAVGDGGSMVERDRP
ncbi:hypothetical protein SAMN05421858_0483 [Haladaptatus litoreus]|uniref:Photosynthesis system II assembly factor Ycf48/Hcf136-like domain-containing protein n=1 Tax=Haladaptatus litoreus TaxID=553468 RepID=A0A1N6VTY9_9EURY|nr:hypothetical protein [Haladaptatus litoreus]SIQ81248.1 hypothetical protein SAMN05421858_0483 [Haladaptatus litoreus]